MVIESHDALRELLAQENLSEGQQSELAAHLLSCEECRAKAREMHRYPGGHLDDDEAFRFSNEDVYGDDLERMSEHLNECMTCALQVALYDASSEFELAEDGLDCEPPATDYELQGMASERWPYLPWKIGEGFVFKS